MDAEIEKIACGVKLSPAIIRFIDVPRWGNDLRSPPEGMTNAEATAHVGNRAAFYEIMGCVDCELWVEYCEDFKKWEEKDFQKVNYSCLAVLKKTLRTRGVYTGRMNDVVISSLMDVASAEDDPEWPDQEILRQPYFFEGSELHEVKMRLKDKATTPRMKSLTPLPPPQTQSKPDTVYRTAIPSKDEDIRSETSIPEDHEPATGQPRLRFSHSTHQSFDHEEPTRKQPSTSRYGSPPQNPVSIQPKTSRSTERPPEPEPPPDYDPYYTLPPRHYENKEMDHHLITKFLKGLQDYNRYSGKAYNVLDEKIRVMLRLCEAVSIPPENFWNVLPYILTGDARRFYMVEAAGRKKTFAEGYNLLKEKFENNNVRQKYFDDWNRLTFNQIRAENPEKKMREVLEA